ncbi:MAG TPA: phosphocholine cytidylyltransferase family protein [Alphaproteobacteria bacterium]|nr:phosphocholine cytidylyltransferase family protein [Alphaproteobacteria bacterium]
MLALMLAAGIGERLGKGGTRPPKALLRFGDESLLGRHIAILRHFGVDRVEIATGYRAESIGAELHRLDTDGFVGTTFNPHFRAGSILSLWALRSHLLSGQDVVIMDADVLYDHRLLAPLLGSRHGNCFLLDSTSGKDDESVKIGVDNGSIVTLDRRLPTSQECAGEWVGFVRLTPQAAARLVEAMRLHIDYGRSSLWLEAALGDLLSGPRELHFGFEDVAGLPWIEIDFPEDVARAEREIFPRLEALPKQQSGANAGAE